VTVLSPAAAPARSTAADPVKAPVSSVPRIQFGIIDPISSCSVSATPVTASSNHGASSLGAGADFFER
jgi:hypothetical protein